MPPVSPEPGDSPHKLPQDYDPPASLPDDNYDPGDADHPQADVDVDPHELEDEGVDGAIELNDPLGPRSNKPIERGVRLDPEKLGYDIEPTEDEVL